MADTSEQMEAATAAGAVEQTRDSSPQGDEMQQRQQDGLSQDYCHTEDFVQQPPVVDGAARQVPDVVSCAGVVVRNRGALAAAARSW